jgi:hypothetical protein
MNNILGAVRELQPLLTRVLLSLLGFAFLSLYSRIIFIAYMASEGFFSYDFVISSEYGSGAIFLISELSMVVLSLMFFGLLLPWMQKREQGKADRSQWIIFGSIACFAWGLLLSVIWAGKIAIEDHPRFTVPLCIGCVISIYIALVLYSKPALKVKEFVLLVFTLISLTFIAPKESSGILRFGL